MDYYINPFLLFSLATFSLLFLLQLLPERKPSNLPPGPTPFPIIGNLLELGNTPHRSLARLARAHGPIFSIKLGQTTTIVASSPELAKQVLQTHDASLSAHTMPDVFNTLGHIHSSLIAMSPSPQWKYLRTIMKTHLFSTQQLDANRSLRKKKVEEMVEHVRGRMGMEVDIGRAALCTMVNEISNLFFSTDLMDINSNKAEKFKVWVGEVMELVGKPNISDFFPVVALADLQGNRRNTEGHVKNLYKVFDDMIDQRLEKLSSLSNGDFLDALIRLHVEDDSKLDRLSIRALLLDNFVAGSDTSSIMVEWAMTELLRHPTLMEKARAELASVVGPKGQVDESNLPQLPFLQAIVKETFRLHPSTPLLIPHKAETSIDLSGYRIPENTRVMVNVWAIGRDESIWEDAELFKPERFIGSEVNYKGRHFELIPFGSGRRICPALPLAHLMVHMMLGSLIHSFKWSLPNGMKPSDIDMTENFGLTVRKAVPLHAIPFPVK